MTEAPVEQRTDARDGSRARGIPCGFLGMLVLVFGLEACLESIGRQYTDFVTRDWQRSGNEVEGDLRRYQVLCFGDSQVKTGVVPQVIEARTGLPAHNFALVGGQAPASYFLLRRALAHNARPAAIVVDFLPPLLSVDLRRSERYFPELLGLREAAELAWTHRDATEFLALASAILIPSVRLRNDLDKAIVAALAGKSAAQTGAAVMRRNRRVNQGALLLEPQAIKEDPDLWYRMNYPRPWECHRLEAPYVDRFFALTAAHGIAVYWLLHPIAPAAQAFCTEGGQDLPYDRFVCTILKRYPNVIAVDGRHAGYRDTAFVDTVHMNDRGAAGLSADLADVLGNPPRHPERGEHWVRLPPYRERPAAVPLENCTQSAQALNPAKRRR